MSKYHQLTQHLHAQPWNDIPMEFAEIEAVLGAKLPRSAYVHGAWWANEAGGSHVQAKAWMKAGFETADVDPAAGKVTFKRVQTGETSAMPQSVQDRVATYGADSAKTLRRNPLFGAMKGTFWIDPERDLTGSSLSDDERTAWDESLDHKAALIDAGLSRTR